LCLPFHHPGRGTLYDEEGGGGEKRRVGMI